MGGGNAIPVALYSPRCPCGSDSSWRTGRGSRPRSRSSWPCSATSSASTRCGSRRPGARTRCRCSAISPARTERIALGSGLMQIPARQPAATAMAAATLDVLSGGRFRLGLGLSGPQVSEGWYGVPFTTAARAHARVRRDRAQGRSRARRSSTTARTGRCRSRRGRHRPRQAAEAAGQAGPGPHPDLPRVRSARRRSSRPARSPTAGCPFLLDPAPARAAARAAAPRRSRKPGRDARGHRRRAGRAGGGPRGRRGRPRPRAAVAGVLPRGDGREGQELLRRAGRRATATATPPAPCQDGVPRRRPHGRGARDHRRADRLGGDRDDARPACPTRLAAYEAAGVTTLVAVPERRRQGRGRARARRRRASSA